MPIDPEGLDPTEIIYKNRACSAYKLDIKNDKQNYYDVGHGGNSTENRWIESIVPFCQNALQFLRRSRSPMWDLLKLSHMDGNTQASHEQRGLRAKLQSSALFAS